LRGTMNTRTADHVAVSTADRSKPRIAGLGDQPTRIRIVLP
jgi:hypothetical protein